MRLSPARVAQTLSQFEAYVIPDDHPSLPQIKSRWGDHTYFLAVNGLNIVEPIEGREAGDSGVQEAAVINLATWTDDTATALEPHEPEPTEVVVELDPEEPAEGSDIVH